MVEQYVQSLAHFLQANPSWGGLMTFFIAFLESLAIIGTIVPGSITMTAVGMLIGASILPFCPTLLLATLGAFLGDLLGYWLGSYYNVGLRNMWPFKKYPHWLEAGENFFHRHGGKSILIGRFMGPLRSIIPMIAGILRMSWCRFCIAAIPTAFLWALIYVLPGILLGALSLQLPPHLATRFIILLFSLIIGLTVAAWLINLCSAKVNRLLSYVLKKMWHYLHVHPQYRFFTSLIASENESENYRQLGLFITALFSFILFLVIAVSVYEHNLLTYLNQPIFEFLRSIRTLKTDKAMIGITLLGDGFALLISTLFILGWFFWQKKYYTGWHWLLAIGIGILIPHLFKYLFYFPRPTGLLDTSSTSSFPSGHAFLSVMYYGFLATLITTTIKSKYKRYSYYAACILILLIGFSRLYLGAHWLTDILASFFIGYTFLAFVIISYRRKLTNGSIFELALFALLVTLTIWVIYFIFNYQKNALRYSLNWPSQVISTTTWWNQINPAIPIYRPNRIGQPDEPLNIQYSGNIAQLKRILSEEGWKVYPHMTLIKTTIHKLSQPPISLTPPLLPSLYLNKPPALMMIKENKKVKLILKLWTSNVYISEPWDVIYAGNITEYKISSNQKIFYSFNVISKLIPFLKANEWRLTLIHAEDIPMELIKRKWNGQILQISAPMLY
jgi:membrane protein DedA with SNARE-associated domain/membrane-associated phospholipid phosphatase